MIDRGRYSILGIRISAVDYDAALDRILGAARRGMPLSVSALAVHGIMTGALDRTHRHRLNRLDLLLPDGQPVRWALNWLYGTALPDRVCGPRLMFELCRRAADEELPIFLFGCDEPMLGALQAQLRRKFPRLQIAGSRPSRFRALSAEERSALVEEIRASGARIAFVGIGCPRQEVFVYEMRDWLPMPLVAVGAAFTFHAELLPKAPPRWERAGLEWLFRLANEPRRLWRRYVLLNPLYLALLALQASGFFSINPENSSAPREELRYG